jgi:cyclic-di-GMP phosphodiesterase, flagellum assembly factor TipF
MVSCTQVQRRFRNGSMNLKTKEPRTMRLMVLLTSSAGLPLLAAIAIVWGETVLSAGFLAALAVMISLANLATIVYFSRKLGLLSEQKEKTSSDLDIISKRLLKIEAEMGGQDSTSSANIDEINDEMALLGGLVRDLAEAVFNHDREVSSLKLQLEEAALHPDKSVDSTSENTSQVKLSGEAVLRELAPQEVMLSKMEPMKPSTAESESVLQAAIFSSRQIDPASAAPIIIVNPPSQPMALAPIPIVSPKFESANTKPAAQPAMSIPVPEINVKQSSPAEIALDQNKIELYLQPVVTLPQRKIFAYEALARLPVDGALIMPNDFLPLIERRGGMIAFDVAIMTKAAAIARHLGSKGSEAVISFNIDAATLRSPEFLTKAARLIETHPELRRRLVAEAPQKAWRHLTSAEMGALRRLRDFGLGFAMDRVTDLKIEPWSLADIGLTWVKAPISLLNDDGYEGQNGVAPSDLPAALDRAGIKLIAEQVESEKHVLELIDIDAPLAQGFLFSQPRPVRADVYDMIPETGSSGRQETNQRQEASLRQEDEAVPLRSFLRRVG